MDFKATECHLWALKITIPDKIRSLRSAYGLALLAQKIPLCINKSKGGRKRNFDGQAQSSDALTPTDSWSNCSLIQNKTIKASK